MDGGSERSVGQKSRKRKKETGQETLEDQPWYYGTLPREEIKEHLKEEGDFLARASEKEGGRLQMVISVRYRGEINHFIVMRDREGWRLEEGAFPTIPALVRHYRKNRIPLTKDKPAMLQTPIRKLRWMLDTRDIHMDKKLGGGQFGNVHAGKMRLQDGETWIRVAIKRCTKTAPMSAEEKQEFLNEAKLMLKYQHENVVKIHGVCANRPPIMIIMELCAEGALDKYLRRNKGQTTTEEKVRFCMEAAKGMAYLAEKECVHRDLAARNCLLGTRRTLKIGDFGMSRTGKYQVVPTEGRKIPLRWTAPESLRAGQFTSLSDVYSFGVLCWEIFANGEQPWANIPDKKKVFQMVVSGRKQEIPRSTPQSVREVITSAWATNPQDRPPFSQLRDNLVGIQRSLKNTAGFYN